MRVEKKKKKRLTSFIGLEKVKPLIDPEKRGPPSPRTHAKLSCSVAAGPSRTGRLTMLAFVPGLDACAAPLWWCPIRVKG